MAIVKPKAAKKAGSSKKKKAAVKSGEMLELTKELKSLIPKLDEEGLAFLVKQAHVHLYNMQVDALNKTIIKDEQRKKVSAGKQPAKKADGVFSDIKMSDSGSSYYIVYNGEWIAFSKSEMTSIAKIVLGAGSDLEIRERLYNWLSKERGDLLYTAGIGDKFNNKLKSLVALIKENFKLKK